VGGEGLRSADGSPTHADLQHDGGVGVRAQPRTPPGRGGGDGGFGEGVSGTAGAGAGAVAAVAGACACVCVCVSMCLSLCVCLCVFCWRIALRIATMTLSAPQAPSCCHHLLPTSPALSVQMDWWAPSLGSEGGSQVSAPGCQTPRRQGTPVLG